MLSESLQSTVLLVLLHILIFRLSAALSYYTLFSLAPLLTIALAIEGVVIAEDAVKHELRDQFQGLIGKPGVEAVANMLDSASQPVHGGIATIVSLVTLVVVSMGMFGELQDALNSLLRIPSPAFDNTRLTCCRFHLGFMASSAGMVKTKWDGQ